MKQKRHGDRTINNTAPEYAAWKSMRGRCESPSHQAYSRYGGRGITVCERWNDYTMFLSDMGRKPSKAHSLDRIDNNKGYSPENCRWATRKEQNRNRRSNRIVEFLGRRQSVADWCDELGLNRNAIYLRLWHGVPVEVAFTTPVKYRKRKNEPDQSGRWVAA